MRYRQGLFFFLLLSPLVLVSVISAEDLPLSNKIIVVDAGHGTLSYQASIINEGQRGYYGILENKTTLEIAHRLGAVLEKEGARVVYTRTFFDYWRQGMSAAEDNKNRALFANEIRGDLLLSIHCDWSPRRKSMGVTTLYESENSKKFGEHIHERMVKDLKAHDRHLVRDNFTILDFAKMPALIIETGFMSNRQEAKKLIDPHYQEKIAQAITDGIKNYFSN